MLSISRRCIPYTPFDKDLSTAIVALVSATGVYTADQEPFPGEDPGDISYRVIPAETPALDLRIAHHHYDHSEADADPNIVFPIDTLNELVAEGFIAGVNPLHYSYGFTTKLRELYEQTFPEIADRIDRSKTKAVILTAGCPETCHRSIATLAREIESRGVPTMIISANPTATESVRPPRGMTWSGAQIGRVVGRVNDRETHKRVLKTALSMLTHATPPGKVISREISAAHSQPD
jgi:D-proline reductase (dithiol) PrdB